MSHLKLQKILYFVQAFHLAYFDQELIADDFEAWVHGPVSRVVYNELKNQSKIYDELIFNTKESGTLPSFEIEELLTIDQFELINDVIEEYILKSGGELEALTHTEQPWINARKGFAPCDKCCTVIPKEEIKILYKQYLS